MLINKQHSNNSHILQLTENQQPTNQIGRQKKADL
jgi:hypothetical protein